MKFRQLVAVGERQWPQEDGIDRGEDGAVRAYAESERQNDRDRK